MKAIRCLIMCFAISVVLIAPAASAQQTDDQRPCFYARDMQGWSALERNSFLIRATGKRYYHFKVKGLCPNLKFARVLTFKSNSTRVCGDTGETVRVERQRCFIDSMQALDQEQYRALKNR